MNRFSHVDLAAPLSPRMRGGEGKGGTLMPVIAGARGPPLSPPPAGGKGGGQGGRLHGARGNDHRARRRRAPPLSPPCRGGAGGRTQIMDERRNDPGLQPALGLLIDGAPRRTAAERWASCARALPCDALSLPKRGRCNRPPLPPPQGGEGGAQRVVALRGVFGHEGQVGSAAPEPVEATKARSSSLTSLG